MTATSPFRNFGDAVCQGPRRAEELRRILAPFTFDGTECHAVVNIELPGLEYEITASNRAPAAGAGNLVRTLREEGFRVTGTHDNFLAKSVAPPGIASIATNPPFGVGGKLAVRFIEHALELVPLVAMLTRIDFDSGRTRVHLFRDHPHFAQKIVLLRRIVWFEREGAAGPSENHCWLIWDRHHCGPPTIAYAGNGELKSPQTNAPDDVFRQRGLKGGPESCLLVAQ
jgi:hypothetical protein